MPPGIGDAILDVIRLIKKTEFLVITTPSKVALETVKKVLKMLKELGIQTIGVVENMKTGESYTKKEIEKLEIPYLGEIYFDKDFENSIGDTERLLKTEFARSIKNIILKTFNNF